MEGPTTTLPAVDNEHDERLDSGSSAAPIVAVIIATVVLYFAKEILMPFAMAALLAVIFSPIASRLDRYVGGFVSAALVVGAAVSIAIGIGYFVTTLCNIIRGFRYKFRAAYTCRFPISSDRAISA